MGSRLVDADALYGAFEDAKWYDNRDRDDVAEDILMDAPIIDAISVARCEGCEYCTMDSSQADVLYTQKCSSCNVEVFVEGKDLAINTYNHQTGETEDISFCFPINYCPICGRKLT